MKNFLLRQFTMPLVLISVLIAIVLGLVFVALLFPHFENTCQPGAAICLNPLGLRLLMGCVLIAGAPLNVIDLTIMVRAALRPPQSTAMDALIQHFVVATAASLCFGLLGFYLLFPHLQQNGTVIAVAFLIGMVITAGKPLVFLWTIWRRRSAAPTVTEAKEVHMGGTTDNPTPAPVPVPPAEPGFLTTEFWATQGGAAVTLGLTTATDFGLNLTNAQRVDIAGIGALLIVVAEGVYAIARSIRKKGTPAS